MERMEDTLPYDESLEGRVAGLHDMVYRWVEESRRSKEDVLNFEMEAELNLTLEGVDKFAAILVRIYAIDQGIVASLDEENIASLYDAIYRALCFAWQLCDGLLSDYESLPLPYLIERSGTGGDEDFDLAPIVEDVKQYYLRRPQLETLVNFYLPEIDVSGRYTQAAKLFAGVILLVTERDVANKYVIAQIDRFGE